MKKQTKIEKRQVGAAVLLGPTRAHLLAIALIGKLDSLHYSRDAESRADLTGADLCAEAGFNPWGLVWLFQEFEGAEIGTGPQLLSNHPNNRHRAAALQRHFRDRPAVFEKFSSDPASAHPMSVPADDAEVLLR
jgi:predicted Zn-dependent protease